MVGERNSGRRVRTLETTCHIEAQSAVIADFRLPFCIPCFSETTHLLLRLDAEDFPNTVMAWFYGHVTKRFQGTLMQIAVRGLPLDGPCGKKMSVGSVAFTRAI